MERAGRNSHRQSKPPADRERRGQPQRTQYSARLAPFCKTALLFFGLAGAFGTVRYWALTYGSC